jgi:hypothetical protein
VKIIDAKSLDGAHEDRPEILDQMRDHQGRGYRVPLNVKKPPR